MHKKLSILWVVLGLGSRLQVVASLSITEIIVLAAAPCILMRRHQEMKRDGIMPFFILSLLVILGCAVASVANKTNAGFVLRGFATTCIVSCSIIFSHWILRRDPGGFKWFILAAPISAIISTFIFKTAVEVTVLGESSKEIMSGPVFWISRLGPLIMAPTKGWYLHMPLFVNVFTPLFLAGFAMLTTVSGRSAALGAIGFVAFVIIGGRTRKTISRISRNFASICFAGVFLICASYFSYKTAAAQGWLGEDARAKYERQTHGGQGGIGRLLLGGRGESFIGLLACRDKPIIGWGPWAMDENGYAEEFMGKFGTWEDLEDIAKKNEFLARQGVASQMLMCHAYITEFWAWYGIWGLIFWIYVIYVLLRYLKQDVAAVPQWFGWLACSIPGMLWGIFFSPFSDRYGVTQFVVACLVARAVRKGTFQLPIEMQVEIERTERR